MRYHIDTIPVWDAMKLEGECPLCALRRKLELGEASRRPMWIGFWAAR